MISHQGIIRHITDSLDFLNQTDARFRKIFFDTAHFAELKRDDIICSQGMHCSNLAILLSGQARVYKLGATGREISLYRINPGECCILTASCILSDNTFPAIAHCETDLSAVVLPGSAVHNWLREEPVWSRYLFDMIGSRLHEVITLVEEIAFNRVDMRLAAYLLNHCKHSPGEEVIATHQQIAAELGTSREVVSRILKEWEHRDWIKQLRGTVRILAHEQLLEMQQ